MKICPVCNAQLPDAAVFCTNCGSRFAESAADTQQGAQQQGAPQPNAQPGPQPGQQYAQQPYAYPQAYARIDPWDHTSEFEAEDISANKLFAMLPYLLSVVGMIIALLAAKDSKFVAFHIRQAIKILVCDVLLAVIIAVLAITIIVPIAGAVCIIILLVVQIICFFHVCAGKAKEAPIVRSFGFLK